MTELNSPNQIKTNTVQNPGKSKLQLDDLYLKIVKITMIGVMSLALIAIVMLLPLAALSYLQTPAPPPAIQSAPVKEINAEEFKNFLIEQKKRDVLKEEQDKAKAAGNLPAKTVSAAEIVFEKPYEDLVKPMYLCIGDYAKATGAEIDPHEDVIQARDRLRARLESIAKAPVRGEAWIQSVTAFACTILKSPALAELARDNKIGQVVSPLIVFHSRAWDKIQQDKMSFDQNEKLRYTTATGVEYARVTKAKAEAVMMAGAAGVAFAIFIILALYLIFAKIETNLALIYRSIDATKAGNSLTAN